MKLGPHMLGNSAQAVQWARAGAGVVKMVDDFSFAAEADSLPHHPLIIGRVFENVFDPNALLGNDPVSTAWAYISTHLDLKIRLNPAVQYWEGPNECVITSLEAMRWYARFLAEFARIVSGLGKVPVIGGWAVGNPDYPMWAEYRPALESVSRYGAVLSRHSYAGPDQRTWPFLLLRHREDNRIFSEMGFPNLPVLITECGADDAPFGNPPGRAWRDLYGNDADRYCREILFPFDAMIAGDAYVLGATIFTSGNGWPAHNIDGRVSELLIANTFPAPPPVPIPPPPPPDRATHVVNVIRTPTIPAGTPALNVRLYPWGSVTPPLVRVLGQGARVRVEGWFKTSGMRHGWGAISPAFNEWVSGQYLAGLA